jgi:hypothetical protein
MTMKTMKQYADDNGLRLVIVDGKGRANFDVDADGWQHYAYRVKLRDSHTRRTSPVFSWRAGTGYERDPKVEEVLDSVVLDASTALDARDFNDFCAGFGYSTDSRKALATYKACQETAEWLEEFVGGKARLNFLMQSVERL